MHDIDLRILLYREHQPFVGGHFERSVAFNGQF